MKAPLVLEVTKLFVKRSPEEPLSFKFILDNYGHTTRRFGHLENAVFDVLSEEAERWAEVHIQLHPSDLRILHRVKHRLPLLRKFVVVTSHAQEPPGCIDGLQDTPSLRDLVMRYKFSLRRSRDEVLSSSFLAWKLDWSSLTALTIDSAFYSQDLLAFLSQARNLESLSIYQGFQTGVVTARQIRFPRLKRLSISGSFELRFLSIAMAPVLEALSLQLLVTEQSTTICSFLSRSSCTILNLSVLRTTSVAFLHILRHTPQLAHLELQDSPMFDRLKCLDARAYPLVPHLQSLLVTPSNPRQPVFLEEEVQQLVEVVISRTSVDSPSTEKLKSLTLHVPSVFPAELKGLRSLCDSAGVDFKYRRS
ncbi:hypothetical protein APHAL10511_002535 [Amanita phalloides]|nr:hypothetical protein APHAL10511_002535 [Amanita phalloides]